MPFMSVTPKRRAPLKEPPAPSGLLLDAGNYPNATLAYYLEKLRTAYTGAAIEVRRGDSALQDIGFDGNNMLDTTALLAFAGGGSLYIRTWYDQSGNNRHHVETSVAKMHPIVIGGTIVTFQDASHNTLPAVRIDSQVSSGDSTNFGNLSQAVGPGNRLALFCDCEFSANTGPGGSPYFRFNNVGNRYLSTSFYLANWYADLYGSPDGNRSMVIPFTDYQLRQRALFSRDNANNGYAHRSAALWHSETPLSGTDASGTETFRGALGSGLSDMETRLRGIVLWPEQYTTGADWTGITNLLQA